MENNLRLSLKTKWFEMTKAGIKKEDYREINEYWCKRLFKNKIHNDKIKQVINDAIKYYLEFEWQPNFKKFDYNIMTLGYPSNEEKERILKLEHKGIEIGYGKEEWGAETNKLYFIIKHGEIIK